MTEMKFEPSPFPWRIRPTVVNGRVLPNYIEDANTAIVCQYWTGRSKDAPLLAAAPELYVSEAVNVALLKEYVAFLKDIFKLTSIIGQCDPSLVPPELSPEKRQYTLEVLEQRIKDSEAVLAKARGDEQEGR